MRHLPIAAFLLLIGVARHYGWDLVPLDTLKPVVSKMLGSAAAIALLVVIFHLARTRYVLAVVCWYAFEEAQTIVCSAAYIIAPWYVAPGKPLCSSLIEYDIGAVTIVVAALLAYWLPVRSYSVNNDE